MPIDEYVRFVPTDLHREGQSLEDSLEAFAGGLRMAIESAGFTASEVFGTALDYRGFSVKTDACKIIVGVTPDVTSGVSLKNRSDNDHWSVQVYLDDAGWLSSTRSKRWAELKRVERAVHTALSARLGARDLSWLVCGRAEAIGQAMP